MGISLHHRTKLKFADIDYFSMTTKIDLSWLGLNCELQVISITSLKLLIIEPTNGDS